MSVFGEALDESLIEVSESQKGFLFIGAGQFLMPATLTRSIATELCKMITPRYSIMVSVWYGFAGLISGHRVG